MELLLEYIHQINDDDAAADDDDDDVSTISVFPALSAVSVVSAVSAVSDGSDVSVVSAAFHVYTASHVSASSVHAPHRSVSVGASGHKLVLIQVL